MEKKHYKYNSYKEFSKEIINNINYTNEQENNIKFEQINVDKELSIKIKKEVGTYINIEYDNLKNIHIKKLLEKKLKPLITKKKILIIGLGNEEFIADSLGIKVIENIKTNKNINTFLPSIKSKTGFESIDIIKSIIKINKPDQLIVIDSLVTTNPEKLIKNIQITTTGIKPGSGYKKNVKTISKKTIGIPVLSIGVPVVININNSLYIPYELDVQIKIISYLIAESLNEILSTNP